ncbi:hypothetical protein BDM02DRAFT_1402329 [Thelephora ganbajun]|uniref:Uncharacterized protein n=1 Tax=Thelephora ganbajun TaxID=370292 RepID=A0ACB6Z2C1_THEGA|nr:hypothetical protein BDM02DRAFT_1402329 [Thelephora ganbajun]
MRNSLSRTVWDHFRCALCSHKICEPCRHPRILQHRGVRLGIGLLGIFEIPLNNYTGHSYVRHRERIVPACMQKSFPRGSASVSRRQRSHGVCLSVGGLARTLVEPELSSTSISKTYRMDGFRYAGPQPAVVLRALHLRNSNSRLRQRLFQRLPGFENALTWLPASNKEGTKAPETWIAPVHMSFPLDVYAIHTPPGRLNVLTQTQNASLESNPSHLDSTHLISGLSPVRRSRVLLSNINALTTNDVFLL